MTAKVLVHPLLAVLSSFIEFIFKPFVRQPRPSVPKEEAEIVPVLENDARETVREIEERKPEPSPAPKAEIVAERGICLHKSVRFRTKAGNLLSAKVVGYSWEDDGHFLVLSRNGGPLFRRRLC